MEKPDSLFLLIKSLEKNEKRYFRLFASLQKGEKIYNSLFNEIDRQKVYDEAFLLKRFKKTYRQFSAIKAYLYSLILKNLNSYNQNLSADFKIRELQDHANILFRKGLYSQSFKTIAKAKKIARHYEKYPALLDIMKAECELSYFFPENKKHFQVLQEAASETGFILDKLSNVNDRLNISAGLTSFWEKGKPRVPEGLEGMRKTIGKLKFRTNAGSETFESIWYFYYVKQHFYRLSLKYKEAHAFTRKAVEHLESSGDRIHEEITLYFISLHTLLITNIDLGKYQESLEVIKKMQGLINHPAVRPHKGLEAKILSLTCRIEMLLHVDYGQFEKGYKLVSFTEKNLKKFSTLLTPADRIGMYYSLCYVYFCAKEYRNALSWLNKILDHPEIRPDIYLFARVQNLIIHFEIGNLYILDSLIRSTYGFLYKRKVLYKSEKTIILYFKKLIKASDKKQQIRIFGDLKATLIEILKDPHEKILLDYMDIISWLDSKIRNIPFELSVRKKSN